MDRLEILKRSLMGRYLRRCLKSLHCSSAVQIEIGIGIQIEIGEGVLTDCTDPDSDPDFDFDESVPAV